MYFITDYQQKASRQFKVERKKCLQQKVIEQLCKHTGKTKTA